MRILVLIPVAAGLLLTGCSQSNSSTTPPAATNTAATNTAANTANAKPASGTLNYGGVLGQAQNFSINHIDLAQVNQAIQEFKASDGRNPKDLQELIPNYLAKIPVAPAGYKISYDAATGKATVVRQQ